eukprot:166201_1
MAELEEKVQPIISDYRLIDDIHQHKTYKCGNSNCIEIVLSSKLLDCKARYHDKTRQLFCSKCVKFYEKQKICPINKHQNPRFVDAEQVVNFLQIPMLKVICPNSSEYKQRKVNKNINTDEKEGDGLQVIATNANNTGEGCQWKGVYKNLNYHIEHQCTFRAIKCEYIGCENKEKLSVNNYIMHKEQFISKHLDVTYKTMIEMKNKNKEHCESMNALQSELLQIKQNINTDINAKNNVISELRKTIQDLQKQVEDIQLQQNDNEKLNDFEAIVSKYVYLKCSYLISIEAMKWMFYYVFKLIIVCCILVSSSIICAAYDFVGGLVFGSIVFVISSMILLGYYYGFRCWKIYLFLMFMEYIVLVFFRGWNFSGRKNDLWINGFVVVNFYIWAHLYSDGPFYAIYKLVNIIISFCQKQKQD